jgi:hypothetical protein
VLPRVQGNAVEQAVEALVGKAFDGLGGISSVRFTPNQYTRDTRCPWRPTRRATSLGSFRPYQ